MKEQLLRQTKCWVPVSPTGVLWVEWSRKSKIKLAHDLDSRFAGWRELGYRVVKCAVVPDDGR